MTYVIHGATGAQGGPVAAALVAAGKSVVALTRKADVVVPGAQVVAADCSSVTELTEAYLPLAASLAARIEETERRHRSVRVHAVTAADHPARTLLGQAPGAALMVVGRHGRAQSGAPLGSVCHAVAHYARCPVAVVGTD